MAEKQKFRYLWILCSQSTRRKFLELVEEIEKQSEKKTNKQS